MPTEANKAFVRTYLDAWERGDTEALKAMLHPEGVTHTTATRDENSLDFEPRSCAMWHTAFTGTRLRIDKMVAQEDSVAVYFAMAAAHTGDFMGIPATHRKITIGGLEIYRIMSRRAIEIWRLSDSIALMQQLGAI
jgi:predicted ester cyclase